MLLQVAAAQLEVAIHGRDGFNGFREKHFGAAVLNVNSGGWKAPFESMRQGCVPGTQQGAITTVRWEINVKKQKQKHKK